MRRLHPGMLAAAFALLGTGCGSGTCKVKGVVTLDGKPFEGAAVVFVPDGTGGKPASGRTDKDGAFELTTFKPRDGALPGNYAVTISFQRFPDEVQALFKNFDGERATQQEKGEHWRKIMGLMSKHAGDYAAGRIKSPLPSLYADPLKTPFKQRVPVDGEVVLELHKKPT